MNGSSEIAGIIASLIPLILMLADKILMNKFKRAKAFARDSAIELNALNLLLKKRLKRFRRNGEVEMTSDGKYFINQENLRKIKQRRRHRAIIIAIVVLVAITFYLIFK